MKNDLPIKYGEADLNQNLNRPQEMRVFISSTFRDMDDEREYLVKKIFPSLRQICRRRGVEFTEVDLRWGVTEEEAHHGKVISICLEEIDRSRPFFIGMVGSRYGWIPTMEDVGDKALFEKYPWLEGAIAQQKSLTEIEFMHGHLNSEFPAMDSVFLFKTIAELPVQTIYNSESARITELATAVDKKQSLRRRDFSSLEELGTQVFTYLLEAINKYFPENSENAGDVLPEFHRFREFQNAFTQYYVAFDWRLEQLTALVRGNANSLVVYGQSGSGKTSLLCEWIRRNEFLLSKHKIIFYSFSTGNVDYSPSQCLSYIIQQIRAFGKIADDVPTESESIIRDFPLWLARIPVGFSAIIVLDGLDDMYGGLWWLPLTLPHNVQFVITTSSNDVSDTLIGRSWSNMEILSLSDSEIHHFIQEYLGKFSKKLTEAQANSIVNHHLSASPLFLRTILEELRIFGSFDQLQQNLESLLSALTLRQLFEKILDRVEKDFGYFVVQEILLLMLLCKRGVSESEFLAISGLSRFNLSSLLLAVDYHIVRRGGVISYFHNYLRNTAEQRYMRDVEVAERHRQKIINYFLSLPFDERTADELPWLLLSSGDMYNLQNTLANIKTFEYYAKEFRLPELVRYWELCGGLRASLEAYAKSFDEYKRNSTNELHSARIALTLASYFRKAGDSNNAEPFANWAVQIFDKHKGPLDSEFLFSLIDLGTIHVDLGNFGDAESFLRTAYAISEKKYGESNATTLQILEKLADSSLMKGNIPAARTMLQRALSIREKTESVDSIEYAGVLTSVAKSYLYAENYTSAETYSRLALVLLNKLLGNRHPDIAATLEILAKALHKQGEYEKAEELYREVTELWEQAVGDRHPSTLRSICALASCLYEKGRYEDSQQLLQSIVKKQEEILGNLHADIADTHQKIAEAALRSGNNDLAEESLLKTVNIRQGVFGHEHYYLGDSLKNLAEFYIDMGKNAEAGEAISRAWSILTKAFGPDHQKTMKARELMDVLSS